MATAPMSRPGYSTVSVGGQLVTVPSNQSSQVTVNGQKYGVTPGLAGGPTYVTGGGQAPSPSAPITQSTPSNQAQVQEQFANSRQAQLDLAAKQRAQQQAYQTFVNEINRISNFEGLGNAARAEVVNRAQARAQDYYQKVMNDYFSNPNNMVRTGSAPMSRAPDLGPGQNTQNFPIINNLIRNLPQNSFLKNVINTIYNKVDLYSGGGLSRPKLDLLQDQLNKRVDDFQRNYANKSFANPSDYNKANSLYLELTTSQAAIDAARAKGQQGLTDVLRGAKNFNPSAPAVKLGLTSPLKKSVEAGAASALANAGVNLIQLPSSIVTLLRNPSIIKNIPSGMVTQIKDSIKSDKDIIMLNPTAGIARVVTQVGTQYVGFKVTDTGVSLIGKLGGKVINRLDPYFVGAARTGRALELPAERGGRLSLQVVRNIPKESIAAQLERAGTRVNAISSQADTLVGLLRRSKVIRKPIPREEKLSSATKSLLRKFDKGTINARELIQLNKKVKLTGSKGLLERSFFADPNLRIRPSRLGITKANEGTLSDLIRGNATFKRNKPQILLFENKLVEKFPSSLRKIVNKIRNNVSLTSKETEKLLSFQLKKSGQFKPLGFVTRESEVTLAPGEIIRRVKRLATTEINGRRVPIIKAEVVQASRRTEKLLNKLREGTIKKSEVKSLKSALKRETGFKDIGSYLSKQKKYISPYKYAARTLPSVMRSAKVLSKNVRYTSSGQPYIKTSIGSRFISPSQINRGKYTGSTTIRSPGKISPPTKSPPRTPTSPPKYPPKYPPYYPRYPKSPIKQLRISAESGLRRNLSKAIPAFNVYAKVGRRFIKINKGVLSRQDALNKGAYAIDNTVAKTFKIISAGKRRTIHGISNVEQNYYKRAGYKLREYKIRRGRKFGLAPKEYIEKRRFGIDTRGEKKGLTIARYLKGYGKGGRGYAVKRARRISAAQRKVMLKNLRKARRVLARKR